MSKSKKCFVISPIGDKYSEIRARSDQVLKYAIEPAAREYGYETIRADQIAMPGIITSQIIEHLFHDELVIADLTGKNPNVFYELAIRHAVRRPVIQIKEQSETIPFDVTWVRTIDLDYRFFDSVDACRKDIVEQIKAIEKPDFVVTSPITYTLNLLSVGKNSESQSNVLMELASQVQALSAEVADLKSRIPARTRRTIVPSLLRSDSNDELESRLKVLKKALEPDDSKEGL